MSFPPSLSPSLLLLSGAAAPLPMRARRKVQRASEEHVVVEWSCMGDENITEKNVQKNEYLFCSFLVFPPSMKIRS